jgi:hypothetical protein
MEEKKRLKLRRVTRNIETALLRVTFLNIFKVSSISVTLCSGCQTNEIWPPLDMYRAVRNIICLGDEITAGTSGWPARSLSVHQLLAAPCPQIA